MGLTYTLKEYTRRNRDHPAHMNPRSGDRQITLLLGNRQLFEYTVKVTRGY